MFVKRKKTFICCFINDLFSSADESNMELVSAARAVVAVALVISSRPSVWKEKILPSLSWSEEKSLSEIVSCKPWSGVETGKAVQFQFPLAAAEQVVSVNGCGHPPSQAHRALPLPSKSHLHRLGTGCAWPFSGAGFGCAATNAITAFITQVSVISDHTFWRIRNPADRQEWQVSLCTKQGLQIKSS